MRARLYSATVSTFGPGVCKRVGQLRGDGLWAALLFMALLRPGGLVHAEELARSQDEEGIAIASTCQDLRRLTENLDAEVEGRVELSVHGALTMAEFDGALAYFAVCAAPDPQVLCVAYGLNGLEIGDTVILNGGLGGYKRPDPDHILLDPCLPSRQEHSMLPLKLADEGAGWPLQP